MKNFDHLQAVLLDVEGTTSSVNYVYDVLFPYARCNAPDFLQHTWTDDRVQGALAQMAIDAGFSGRPWPSVEAAMGEVIRLMDGDIKATGLKELQGLIWARGYEAGQLISHIYEDVPGALQKWRQDGLSLHIYSSGSVTAQKVFFAHTAYGDLSKLFTGHYDTTSGAKREGQSYTNIAAAMGIEIGAILFLSDIGAELDAAASVGMQTALVLRPGNAAQVNSNHVELNTFSDIQLTAHQVTA